jgi:ligand-binding SRPBCC domain-containing protein
MNTFDYQFSVKAPISAVSDFHHDPNILKKLTPPPIFIQVHQFDPLADGSTAELTMWFGPIPVPWTAVHTNVTQQGFTDTQHRGPLKHWQHTPRFTALNERQTLVKEHIEYVYTKGIWGLLSRLLFNRAGLFLLFTARKWLTRWHIGRQITADDQAVPKER